MSTWPQLQEAANLLQDWLSLRPDQQIDIFAQTIADSISKGGKIICLGNGGSLADAAHFAEEFTGRFKGDRRPLPAIACTDACHITCVANDFGFDHVFSRFVEALAKKGDVVLLLTTSGMSQNLIHAAASAKQKGAITIALTGKGGGELKSIVDHCLDFPGKSSDRIQELQMLTLHVITEEVEKLLGLS